MKKQKEPKLTKKEKIESSRLTDKEELLSKIGIRMRQLRIKKGYTNYEYFAYENELNRAQYGRYERGYDLKISTLNKIVKALGLTMEEFFSEGFD